MLSVTINITWRTIMAALFVGVAVAISSLDIGRAEHVTPNAKVFSCSTGTACLTGNSTGTKTYGIYAESASYDGLHAVTSTTSGNSAVAGIATGSNSGNGNGVYGRSSNGDGVHGSSNFGNGVYGVTTALGARSAVAGVFGEADQGIYPGVEGYANHSTGGATGVFAHVSGGGVGSQAVFALSDGSPYIFYGADSQTGGACTIDPNANLTCSGKISGGSELLTRQRSTTGRHVLTYSAQSATPTIEDLGASQMHDGVANIELPADFSSVIDRSSSYYVFLTPMGDTRGLYVSMETSAGFQVRENMHGRSSVPFQYRIIAVPLGKDNARLPSAPIMRPRVPIPGAPDSEH